MKLIKKICLVLCIGAVVICGFFFTIYSWDGWVYSFRDENFRGVADIQENESLDASFIEGGSLRATSPQNLIKKASIVTSKTGVGVRLGHFTILEKNKIISVCEAYDKIEMTFVADGVTVSGEMCLLIVESDCLLGEPNYQIQTIWIPFAEITQRPPSEIQLTTTQGQLTHIRTTNITDSWPEEWSLLTLRLFNSGASKKKEFFFDEKQLLDIPPPIRVVWSSH